MSTADAGRLSAFWSVRARSRCGRPVPLRPPRAPSRATGPHSHPPGEQAGRGRHARGAAAPRVDGRHLRRIRREPERRHHQDSSRPQGFRERSPLHRDRSEAWLPLSRRRAGASAWVGVNGRRHASSRRCSFSAVGYRSSTGAAGRWSSTQDRVTRRSWPRRCSLPGCCLPDRATISRAARAVADGAAVRGARRGDAPESGKRAGGGDRQATRSPANDSPSNRGRLAPPPIRAHSVASSGWTRD